MVSEEFVLPGGLRFSENGTIKIMPGCCSGLEDWREWLNVPDGKPVWAGHDPTPGLEFRDGYVRLWQDENLRSADFIDFGIEEMRSSLMRVEIDLRDFVGRLSKWTGIVAPTFKESLVDHFVKNMNVGPVSSQ